MKFLFFYLFLFVSIFSNSQNIRKVEDVARRNVPWLLPHLKFDVISTENDEDYFEIEQKNKKIVISANSQIAFSRGLGHYLRFVAHKSPSHLGNNLSKPTKIAFPDEKICIKSPFLYRYSLNYCTLSYSMSFYSWEDWQKELDWHALKGVNLMLMPLGNEIIWLKTLQKLGLTKDEAKKYIATPTFSAWWQMGNLENWHGEITDEVIEEQRVLAHKVFSRMKELGIKPIYQGFYGNIPTFLKEKLPIKVVGQGKWAGGFERPDMLHPQDAHFQQIASIYYNEIKKEYGDFEFFGGDPFHEGGRVGEINVKEAGKNIQQYMQAVFPNATWVLQGWAENPSDVLLEDLDKNKTLILELEGENTANWEKRKVYGGFPFVWCQISNFGAKTGLYGKMQRFSDEVFRLQYSDYQQFAKGIGIIPEGIHNNPLVYDFTLDLAWRKQSEGKQKINVSDWIKDYILYRYGKSTPNLQKAWEILLETVYQSHQKYQQGASESMLCATPSWGLKSVSSWGTIERNYSADELKKAVKLFLSEQENFKKIETYQTDKIDFLRQLNSDKSVQLYNELQSNFTNGEREKFIKNKDKFLNLILIQDKLLSVSPHFRLDTFLKQAFSSSKDKKSQKNAVKNAKVQITYWGTDKNPYTNLRDYAHKEWNGLLSSLYYKRWEAFFNYQISLLDKKQAIEPNYYQVAIDWTESPEMYHSKPLSYKELQNLIEEILKDEN